MLEVPPPVVGGLSGTVEILSVEVEMMFSTAIASARTVFGLSTIACLTPGMSAAGVRNAEGVARFDSGNGTRFAGLPI